MNEGVKKVCHLTSAHTRYDPRILHKQCVSLAQYGYDVSLVVNDNKNDEEYKGVHIFSTGYIPKNRVDRMIHSTVLVLKKALELNADIYCIHDPELLRYASIFSKLKKKVIFDSHEFYALQLREKQYIPKCTRKIISLVYQIFEKIYLKSIDIVLTPCTLNGENYFEKISKKTVFISNVPRLEEFYSKYTKNKNKKKIICYVGSLSYQRGIYHLLLASERAKYKLVLAGNYSSKEFENKIKSLPEYTNVKDLGYLNRDEVFSLYGECEIGMSTLLDFGQYLQCDIMPTKVYEYMSMGIPVIISDTPYVRKIMKRYLFGICVNPQNIDEIADAIMYLNEHPDKAQEMGNQGRKAIVSIFNWEIEEKKLLALYGSLAIAIENNGY